MEVPRLQSRRHSASAAPVLRLPGSKFAPKVAVLHPQLSAVQSPPLRCGGERCCDHQVCAGAQILDEAGHRAIAGTCHRWQRKKSRLTRPNAAKPVVATNLVNPRVRPRPTSPAAGWTSVTSAPVARIASTRARVRTVPPVVEAHGSSVPTTRTCPMPPPVISGSHNAGRKNPAASPETLVRCLGDSQAATALASFEEDRIGSTHPRDPTAEGVNQVTLEIAKWPSCFSRLSNTPIIVQAAVARVYSQPKTLTSRGLQ